MFYQYFPTQRRLPFLHPPFTRGLPFSIVTSEGVRAAKTIIRYFMTAKYLPVLFLSKTSLLSLFFEDLDDGRRMHGYTYLHLT